MAKNSELEQQVKNLEYLNEYYKNQTKDVETEYFGYRKGITEALVSLAGKHIEFD